MIHLEGSHQAVFFLFKKCIFTIESIIDVPIFPQLDCFQLKRKVLGLKGHGSTPQVTFHLIPEYMFTKILPLATLFCHPLYLKYHLSMTPRSYEL